MADVTYNTASFPSLVQTFSRLIQLSAASSDHKTHKPPLFLLGYKERDESERTLWDLARIDAGITFTRVGGRSGSGGNEVEIWIGRVEI